MAENRFLQSPLDKLIQDSQGYELPEVPAPQSVTQKSSPTAAMRSQGLMPPADLQSLFEEASAEFGVPLNVLAALGQQESTYNPMAVGTKTKYGRAKGLMQYIDDTAGSLGINPFDPKQAVRAAAMQMRDRLDKGYTIQEAIMAHHGGDNREQWGPKTQRYVQEVLGKAGEIGQGFMQSAPKAAPDFDPAAIQAELDAKEPGRFKVMSPEDVERYQRRADILSGQGQLQAAQQAVTTPNPITPLTPENQRRVQQSVGGISMLPVEEQQAIKARERDRDAKQLDRVNNPPVLKPYEPTLWDQIKGLGGPDKDAATVELVMREAAKREGISVEEAYRRVGGSRAMFNPEGRPTIQALSEAAQVLGPQINDVAPAAANTAMRAIRNGDVDMDANWLDKAINSTDIEQEGWQDPNYQAFQGVGQSLGFSLVNMAASALAGLAGSAAAGPAGGAGAALGTSGTISYRASKDEFLDRVRKNYVNLYGVAPTQEQWEKMQADADSAATKYGAFEAIPEAISTLIFVRALSRPLAGASRAQRLGDALKRVAENQGSEQTTETITGVGQNRAELEAGLTKEELSAADVFRQNALNVALTSGIMSGGAMAGRAAYDATPMGKRQRIEGELQDEIERNFANWDGTIPQAGVPTGQEANAQPPEEQPVAEQQQADQPTPQQQNPLAGMDTSGNSLIEPAKPSGPLTRAASKATQTEGADRVVVQTPAGPVAGTVESYENGTSGSWQARILGDDGQFYQFSDKDGVQIAPEGAAPDIAQAAPDVTEAAPDIEQPAEEPVQVEQQQEEKAPEFAIPEQPEAAPAAESIAEQVPVNAPKRDDRDYSQMDEAELRERLKYLAGQAKSTGGWNKLLMEERRKVEKAIKALEKPADQMAVKDENPAVEPSAPAQPVADQNPVKWFGSQEKADAFIAKKGMADTHEVVPAGKSRFEIREKAAVNQQLTTEQQPAAVKESLTVEQAPELGQKVVLGKGQVDGTIVDVSTKGVKVQMGTRVELMSEAQLKKRMAAAQEAEKAVEPQAEQQGPSESTAVNDYLAGRRDTPPTVAEVQAEQQAPTPAPAEKMPAPEWWQSATPAERHFRMRAAGVKGTAQTPWNRLNAADQRALNEQWGDRSEQKPVTTKQVGDGITATVIDPSAMRQTVPVEDGRKVQKLRDMRELGRKAGEAGEERAAPEWSTNSDLEEAWLEGYGQGMAARVQAEQQAKPAEYGASNKLVTADRAAEVRAKLKAKLNGSQLNSGFDPEILALGAELAAFHIEAGARKFADFAKVMAQDLDMPLEKVRPYLRGWFNGARDMIEDAGLPIEGMDGPEQVREALAKLDAEVAEQPQEQSNDTQATEANPGAGAAGAEPAGVQADEGQRPAGVVPGEPDGRVRAERGSRNAERAEQPGEQGRPGEGGRAEQPVRGDRGSRAQPGDRADAGNYRIQPGELKRTGSWKATAEQNIRIVELVKQITAEGRQATPEEKALLTKFTGWGASEIANGVFPDQYGRYKDGWRELGERLKAALTPEEYAQAKRTTQYAHYTSEPIIRSVYNAMERMGFNGGQVLEPGMGVGLFNGLMPDAIAANSQYTGIEYDGITGNIARLLYPQSNIVVGDFTQTKLPRDFFDAAIGNPPFGQIKIQSDPEYKKQGFLLHDYFFAKTIDRVKPGGLLVFVTSKGTMDKASDRARKYLSERADLVGAIRLPQTAFKDNAGTEVVTDVIFLRKRAPGQEPAGEAWSGLAEVQTAQGPAYVNEYFAAHPEMVLGKHAKTGSMYRADEYTVEPIEGDIEQLFAKAIENLPEGIYRPERGGQAERAAVQRRDYDPKVKKEGGVYVADDGTLMQVESGQGVPLTTRLGSNGKELDLKPREVEWLKGYTAVRDALKQAQYDQLNDGPWEKSLKALNKAYDAFTKEHGPILAHSVTERENDDGSVTVTRRFKNEPLIRLDAEGALAYALEVVNTDGTLSKGAVLGGRTLNKPTTPTITNAQDAMFVSLNDTGSFNLAGIARLAGKTEAEVISELGDAIYEDPSSGWTTADDYLSGNVVRKLKEAEAAARLNKAYQRNVEALKNVQPRALAPQDITVQLGSAWVPASDVQNFAAEVMGDKLSVSYSPVTGQWNVDGQSSRVSEWGTGDKKPADILDAVLNNRQLKVTYKDAEGKTYTDPEATEKVNDIAKKLRAEFKRWIWADTKRADRLAKFYNENYNNIAPRQFDGSHLTLPGVSSRFNLRPHQKRAIWRTIQQGDTYYAHAVGAGKTFTMIASGMEERRLGLVNKPMYVVPNHMLAQFSKEFLELYPTASIMVADEQNFHTHNRRKFVAQAALNDPDAIVITHSAFGRIGMSPEFSQRFIEGQIEEWNDALEEVDKQDRVTRKQIERRIEQLENRLKGIVDGSKKDQVLSFEELGVDRLYVDEGHEFRKLDFPTNRGNIKGIDSSGSQRAMDLFMKVEYLRQKNQTRALVMASGTPITNTMGELFTVQRFFQPGQLAEDGDSSFDAWANHYGEVVDGLEQNAAGLYETVSRFAKFVNVPELMSRVRSFMDILTSEQLGDLVQRPDVETGGRQVIVTPPPAGYKEYQKQLEDRIKAIRNRKGPPKPGDDIILSVIADGRFSAIDMRFVDPTLPSDPNSKLNVVIDEMIEAYRATAENEYSTGGKVDPIKGGSLMLFTDIGLGEQSAKNRGFDMKAWIEKRLIEGGVKPDHIAFMRDNKAHAKKERLFDDLRQGRKRILIGGKDMETGVNAQKRLVYLGHLDAPWFPASVEQREGRIIRQGNQNKVVTLKAYATKGSYDSTMWGMNARKARFIEQAMSGDTSVRSMEDVSEASAFEMAAALASGDERYLKLAGLKGDVDRLSRLYSAHLDDQRRLRSQKMGYEATIKHNTEQVAELKAAIAKRKPIAAGEFSGTADGKAYDKRDEFSEALFTKFKDLAEAYTPGEQTIGEIGGFPIVYNGVEMRGGSFAADATVTIPGDPDPLITFPIDPDASVSGIATRAANQVNGLDRELTKRQGYIAESTEAIEKIDRRLGASFPEQSELQEKREALAELEAELEAESKAASAEAAAATVEAESSDIEQPIKGDRFSVSSADRVRGFGSKKKLRDFLISGPFGKFLAKRIDEGKIVLHDDASTIPGANGMKSVGGVTSIDGKIHLNAATLGRNRAMGVALHELFHAGAMPLVGTKAWDGLIARLGSLRNQAAKGSPKLRALHDAAMRRVEAANTAQVAAGLKPLSERQRNEEFGAYLIEEYENLPQAYRSWADEFMGMVKAWLLKTFGRQFGRVTPEQLRALSIMALRSDRAMGAEFEFDAPMQSGAGERAQRALQPVQTESGRPAFRSDDGVVLYGTWKHDVTDSDVADRSRLPYGHAAHVTDGNSVWNFKAFKGGQHVADVTLQLDQKGNIDALHDIKAVTRGQGAGEAVVGAILAASRKPLRIIQAVPTAKDFWSKMGANGFFDLYDNTTIDWGSYEANRGSSGRPAQPEGAVRRELPAQREAAARGQADAAGAGESAPLDQESLDYLNNPDAWSRFSVLPDDTALEDATQALDKPEQFKPDFIGQLQQDIGRIARFVLHPRQIAALHKDFTPVYRTAVSQFEMRDSIIDELQQDHKSYDVLSQKSKQRVNAVLELGRLLSASYGEQQLRNGIVNPGEKSVVKFTDGGSTYRVKEKINALLTAKGEVIKLDDAEIEAYLGLRAMFDNALDKFKDQTLADFGFPELAGQKNVAKAIMDMIDDTTPAAKRERLEGIARFVQEIEQAKRTGYVPFARYGDYVVAVKEQQFPLTLIHDPDNGGWITRDLPLPYEKLMDEIGAQWDDLEGGYRLDRVQRQALVKENEKTIHSAKVEFTARDKLLMKTGRPVEELPSVKKALAEAEKWKGDNPNRRIVAFETVQKKPEGGLKLSDVDALAEVAMLDTETWDAVRDQLSDAIKGRSFRKHFFQADNVPGYTEDFERAIADYMAGMAGYLSRRHYNGDWDNAVSSIKAPRLFDYANKYRAYANEPQEELAMLRQIGFFHYIAGVPATAVVNMTQPFLMTIPALGQIAPMPQVIREMARAYKDALAMVRINKRVGLDFFDPTKAPADIRTDLAKAWADGMFVPLQTYEVMATARNRNVGGRRIARGFNQTIQATAALFSFAERLNRLVTFIASARLAQKPGVQAKAGKVYGKNALARQTMLRNWSPSALADFMIDETQFRMGKANRPVISRGLGAVIMQFKGFVMQSLEAWFRLATQNGKEGVKAVALSIGAMMLIGGLWGMPGADDLRDLIEKAYKHVTKQDIDMKTELRRELYEATGQRWISEVASKGATYPFGLDFSRVGMGNIAPDSPLQVFGIPADLFIGRPTRAFGKATQGDAFGAVGEFLPNFLKNPLQAYGWTQSGVRDGAGRLIMDERDVGAEEVTMKSLGFQPSRITDIREYEYAQRRLETANDMLKRDYLSKLAKAIAKAEKYPDQAAEAMQKQEELLAEIEEHNAKARGPEEMIIITRGSLKQRLARELGGVEETWGKERKQARGASQGLREVFGLSEEQE